MGEADICASAATPESSNPVPTSPPSNHYPIPIDLIRQKEYPLLAETTYLDHAGTTPPPASLINRFSYDLLTNLYGNPHSSSSSSQLATRNIEDIRHDALRFFNADPAEFDLVFVANATAGIKLIAEAFREEQGGFWYGYHGAAHTSLVGARELAERGSRCFEDDAEVEEWLEEDQEHDKVDGRGGGGGGGGGVERLELFAYPAQSNMNGRRLPLNWCRRIRHCQHNSCSLRRYTLLDAAALVSTFPLDLGDKDSAPDFTVLSFYKIFGFPDLGALIVRKDSADVLLRRAYFGGGTVDMVVCLKEQWHAKKTDFSHESLEDGTLPVHNIMALRHAMHVHKQLYGSLENVARHTAELADRLYANLQALRHGNGVSVCTIYRDCATDYMDTSQQGPVIAFNIRNAQSIYFSGTEVEKLANIRNIQLRTGGLCNPGGIATALDLAPWEMRQNFSAGQKCGNDGEMLSGKPTGMIRLSLGAMSTQHDIDVFLDFMREFFVDLISARSQELTPPGTPDPSICTNFYIESLTVYPIKSCAGFLVPSHQSWPIYPEGLAWDREWCLVHKGTGDALSQKRYPKMALIRPSLDFEHGVLRVRFAGDMQTEVAVPLSADPRPLADDQYKSQTLAVCGDKVTSRMYTSPNISAFFTAALGVPCTLARFPAHGTAGPSIRHAKAHLGGSQKPRNISSSISTTTAEPRASKPKQSPHSILLSNESPILLITRPSLNRLTSQIKENNGIAPHASAFRANIIVASSLPGNNTVNDTNEAYVEDDWRSLSISAEGTSTTTLKTLGPCRRCQMVTIDQMTGIREAQGEPFATLAKTRRWDGKVRFGVHACLDGVGAGRVDVIVLLWRGVDERQSKAKALMQNTQIRSLIITRCRLLYHEEYARLIQYKYRLNQSLKILAKHSPPSTKKRFTKLQLRPP